MNWRLLAIALLAVSCAPARADGFRDKLAQGCRSPEACRELETEAVNRLTLCERDGHACSREREDAATAVGLMRAERRKQAQVDAWAKERRERERRDLVLREERAQAEAERVEAERQVREKLERRAQERAEVEAAAEAARLEADRAAVERMRQDEAARTRAPSGPPEPAWQPATQCCRVCTTGKACGNSCISRAKTCRKGPGCACDG